MASTYRVECHGIVTSGKTPQIILKVPDISGYVSRYSVAHGIESETSKVLQPLASVDCPIKKQWNADCDGSNHHIVEAVAEMARGALRPPPQDSDGSARDPNVPYNYKWDFVRFVSSGGASDSPQQENLSKGGRDPLEGLTSGEMAQLNRELATNDRTALMQSVAYGTMEPEGVIANATIFAEWLNQRSVARANPTVKGLLALGANVTEVKSKEEPQPSTSSQSNNPQEEIEDLPQPVVKNRAELDKWITDNNIEAGMVKIAFTGEGYKDSADWLKQNPESGIQGLANYIWNYFRIEGGELPW